MSHKKQLPKYGLLGLLLAFILVSGFGCKGTSKEVQERLAPIKLEYWTVFNDSSDMYPLIQAYQAIHPNVSVNIKKLRYAEYEETLINALAEDRGPDLFSYHNTWKTEYLPKLSPMPAKITLPFQFVAGNLKKELKTELRTMNSLTTSALKKKYPDVVYQDAKNRNEIVGLPLYMDTMVMYYNIDVLNNAGIAEPPTNWEDFRQQVISITQKGQEGEIQQSAVSMGLHENISVPFDLLSLLMMQNGTQMMNQNSVSFDLLPAGESRSELPAKEALLFYTSFANPASENYTWNETYSSDLDAFIQGETAFFFGYHYHLDDIKARAPKLNFEISPMLQMTEGNTINYANYWLEGVSKKSTKQDWAWDLLQFIAKEEQLEKYLETSKRVTPLRSQINAQKENPELSVFVSQILTSKSWYFGNDADIAQEAFAELIDTTLNPRPNQTIESRLKLAAQKIKQTY